MTRLLAACAILLAVAPVGSAPRLKDEPRGVYFPMTVGDRWVVEMRYATTTSEYTETVTAVEKADGGTVVTVARGADGQPDSHSQVKVTDQGLFRVSNLGTTYDPPYCILKFPVK